MNIRTNASHFHVRTTNRKHFTSYGFSIRRSFRNPNGDPRHDVLAYFGTVRSTDIHKVNSVFWESVDRRVNQLIKSNTINITDAAAGCLKFKKIIPRPAAPVPATATIPKISEIEKQKLIAELNL